jgi:hypothetical protein
MKAGDYMIHVREQIQDSDLKFDRFSLSKHVS